MLRSPHLSLILGDRARRLSTVARQETDPAGRVVTGHELRPRGPRRRRLYRGVSGRGPKSFLALEVGDEGPPDRRQI